MVFQVGAALLDACILAVLSHDDAYGYVLTQNVKEILNVSESTLYPVLRRLQKDDFLTAYDMPYAGRNRRYYSLTGSGKTLLESYVREWYDYKEKVDRILMGQTASHDAQTPPEAQTLPETQTQMVHDAQIQTQPEAQTQTQTSHGAQTQPATQAPPEAQGLTGGEQDEQE